MKEKVEIPRCVITHATLLKDDINGRRIHVCVHAFQRSCPNILCITTKRFLTMWYPEGHQRVCSLLRQDAFNATKEKTMVQFVFFVRVQDLSRRRLGLCSVHEIINGLVRWHLRQWCQPAIGLVKATDGFDESDEAWSFCLSDTALELDNQGLDVHALRRKRVINFLRRGNAGVG
jgi:hypothetical protein